MCQFFSFVTYKGQKFFCNDLDREVVDNPDSHTNICNLFHLPEDKCNKYEWVDGRLIRDSIVDKEEVLEDVQAWIENLVQSPAFTRIKDVLIKRLITQSTDKHYAIRCGVAENTNTPSETLVVLSKDEDSEVRHSVAENTNTPSETLVVLSKDENYGIRYRAMNTLARKSCR